MARLGRGLGGGSVGGARHAAALLAAARDRGHRGLRLAVAGRADAAQRLLARAGLGHGPFRRRLLLDPGSLLCPAGRLRPARPADRRRPRGRAGILSGARRLGVAPHHRSLARSRRPLQPPGCAGDRLDGCRVAARAPLHRLSVESAGACLGLCHAFATGRGAVRRLWPWHVDLPRARSADGRLAGIDRGTPGGRPRGLGRPVGDGRHRQRQAVPGSASCSPTCRRRRNGVRKPAPSRSPSWWR